MWGRSAHWEGAFPSPTRIHSGLVTEGARQLGSMNSLNSSMCLNLTQTPMGEED